MIKLWGPGLCVMLGLLLTLPVLTPAQIAIPPTFCVEADGSPDVPCLRMVFPNDSLGVNQDGSVSIDTGGGTGHAPVTLSTDLETNLLGISGQLLSLDNQPEHCVFAGPLDPPNAAPTCRPLVREDIPASVCPDPEVVAVIESLSAADDNFEFFMRSQAVTITGIACHCRGTCTTPAVFALEDRAGNAMTHAPPVCSVGTADTPAPTPVTAANGLNAGEGLAFDVTNAVAPETDTYTLLVTYTVN